MELKSKEYWKAEIECQNEFLAKKLRKKLGKVFPESVTSHQIILDSPLKSTT